MTKDQVDTILKSIGYYDSFKQIMNQSFIVIDYGKKLGKKKFDSLFDAHTKYTYNGEVDPNQYRTWHTILNSENVSEEELLVACLKIFDWGKVLPGNVRSVIGLYEQKKLKEYIFSVKEFLKYQKTIDISDLVNDNIQWSSGWTKVYSFINPNILIYDSRVSAFLNFTLIRNYNTLNKTQKEDFHILTKSLFNFRGFGKRERKVSNIFGFKNQHPKGIAGFNANLISSWIIQCTKEHLAINEEIRSFERAFFMLGFDLKQIK